MKKYLHTLLGAGVFATALISSTFAATGDLSHSDKAFFEKAAKSGMKEVAVSQAAMTNLTSPGLKDFAQMMVTDHSKANMELKALADQKGVTLPAEDPKISEKWGKNRKDADDEYIAEMVDDHKAAVDLFEKASKSKDADIAAFAQKTLPTLRHHLEMAKSQKKMN